MDSKEIENQVQEIENNKGDKKKRKSPLKYIANIFLVLIATGISLYFALKDNLDTIVSILKTAELKYVLVIVGLMCGLFLVRGFILFIFARLYTRRYHLYQGLAIDQIGFFFNSVTMGATGGQIMQAMTYKKQGVHISAAVSILAMYSIVFQLVLILFGISSFIFKYDFISELGSIGPFRFMEVEFSIPLWPLTIIGFILNLSIILLVFLMAYWHKFHNFIMGPVVSFLAKIRILKHPDKTRENLRIQVENFKIEFSRLLTNIPFFILVTICFVIYFLIRFSVPYFCALALDPSIEPSLSNFWNSVFLSNYHQMITGLVPLPGNAGVSELFYSQLFAGYYSTFDYCKASLILWRSSTFIIPTLIAGLVTAFYRASPKNEIAETDFNNRGTFVALQNETITTRQSDLDTMIETTRLSHEAVMAKLKSSRDKRKNRRSDEITNISDDHDNVDVNGDK